NSSCNTGAPGASWLPVANADLIIGDTGTFSGAGLIIGQNRRLIRPFGSSFFCTISDGGGIHAAPGATDVTVAAGKGYMFTLTDSVDLPGVNLHVNDKQPFQTFVPGYLGSWQRVPVEQTGQVQINGQATIGTLTLETGTVDVGNPSGRSCSIDNLVVHEGLAEYLYGKVSVKNI